ncbi:MAG: energy transducer TonB [Chitinispirillales bacterium]|jgi:outer membrane biosynthesis protein TonB|nr:energy transducer TonB [Chitinispirillales bacterium]
MDRLFSIILLTTIAVFFSIGALLYRMGKSDMLLDTAAPEAIQASFVVEEQKAKEADKPKPKPVEKKKVDDAVPVDLTQRPDLVKEKEEAREEEPPQPKREQKPVRQVYGLKKVYSQGLGAGGDSQDAIVGKLGNTLNKDYDTLTASAADLKGQPGQGAGGPVSSAASVTSYPRLKAGFRSLKPQYSKEMLQNRVEGVVKAKILIASDGTVKKVEILSDIGYDSAEIAKEFLMTLQFEPAMKGAQAVSVWIPFSIRFELI